MMHCPHRDVIWRVLAILAILSTWAAAPAWAAPAVTLGVQGRFLTPAGQAVPDGNYSVTIKFYAQEADAVALYTEVQPAVPVKNGLFTAQAGSITPLGATLFKVGDAGWVGLKIASEAELPRVPLKFVPYALRATTASDLYCTGCVKTAHIDATVLQPYALKTSLAAVATTGMYADLAVKPVVPAVNVACGSGLVVQGLDANGALICVSASALVTYTAGTGLTLSGSQFALATPSATTIGGVKSVTCAAGFRVTGVDTAGTLLCTADAAGNTYVAGNGLNLTGNSFALSPPTTVVLGGVKSSTCAVGSKVTGISTAGVLTCGVDIDTITTYVAGAGLTLTGNSFALALPTSAVAGGVKAKTCAVGTKVTGVGTDGVLICAADTAYTAGAGIDLTGTSFSLATPTPTVLGGVLSATCPAGQKVTGVAIDGSITCAPDATGAGSVTSIAAGAGLTGGTITTSGTIALAPPTLTTLGGVKAVTCGVGTKVSAVGVDGTVICSVESGNTYTAGAGLTLTGTQFGLAAPGVATFGGVKAAVCPAGQKVTGIDTNGVVTCGIDLDTNAGGTVTSIAAGAGLTGGTISTTGTIALAPPTASVLGGVKSATCPAGKVVNGVDLAGNVICVSPGSVAGLSSITAGPGLTGGTITTTGTIGLSAPTISILGGVMSLMCPKGQDLKGIGTDGKPVCGNVFDVAQSAPVSCVPSQFGYAYVNDKDSALYICNGATWVPFWLGPVGTSADNPGTNCEAILAAKPDSKDGLYWMKPTGAGTAFQTMCDMTTAGGGWTLVLNLNTDDGAVRHYDDVNFWTGSDTVGSPSAAMTADFKSGAFAALPVGSIMMKVHGDGVFKGFATYDALPSLGGKTLQWAFSSSTNALVTGPRVGNGGAIGSFGTNNAGDAFIDHTEAIIINSTYSPADSVNLTRLGNNYSTSCPTIGCGGHNLGGWGGKHSRPTANWGSLYEGAALMGYCNAQGMYGANYLQNPAYGSFLPNGCGSNVKQPNDLAVYVRTASIAGVVPPVVTTTSQSNPGKDCWNIHKDDPSLPDGVYWIDPNGGSTGDAYQAVCNMTRDGGGWTLGIKSWSGSFGSGVGAQGAVSDATALKGNFYKLSDTDIKLIGTNNFDVMADQAGYNTAYSTGNFEYVVLRNYTGTFTWNTKVAESTTPTTMQSFRASDNALAWSGRLQCGEAGTGGINCYTLPSNVTNPNGGSGCGINMGSSSSSGWHHFAMYWGNDTNLYICNGAQHSSSYNLNHRFWFRPAAGTPDNEGGYTKTGGLPTDCQDLLTQKPGTGDGTYWIDPNGGSTADAYQVKCNMTREGGGWTLGIKNWYESGSGAVTGGTTSAGKSGAFGSVTDADTIKTNFYKLSDTDIKAIASNNYDVMFDQVGYNSAYSSGNFEYIILRNYTAPWTWVAPVGPSSTPTTVSSYRAADNALAWQGGLNDCGHPGTGPGINCYTLSPWSSNPRVGFGCAYNMGNNANTDINGHYLAMTWTNNDTYSYICNGSQHSSSYNLSHRFWFRKKQAWLGAPMPDGTRATTGLPISCLDIKQKYPSAGSGLYWIDPNGGSAQDADPVQCEMTRQGGGWTMGVKHWYGAGDTRNAAAVNGPSVALLQQGYVYKLADAKINTIATSNYDVMFDQAGYDPRNGASGNVEYAVLRNYTATFSWTGLVPASSTPTTISSYRISDNALAWQGNFNNCGYAGGYGINCYTVSPSTVNPMGGGGCSIALAGNSASPGWHNLFMAETNNDSYMYLCNSANSSSNVAMNHRYWFRAAQPWAGVPSYDGTVKTTDLPTSCDDIQAAKPSAATGLYWIDPNGGSSSDAYQVKCDMTRDGGGWTLGIKHWYADQLSAGGTTVPPGYSGAYGAVSGADVARNYAYKLSDVDINTIVGNSASQSNAGYDVMFDQVGYYSGASTGNTEYAVVRNYTAKFTYGAVTPASSTQTSVQSYRISDNALAWNGNMQCGQPGGVGINCGWMANFPGAGVNPSGGSGCNINMSNAGWNAGWNTLYMSNTNSDSYMYLCAGNQASSNSGSMNHRFWFRKTRAFTGGVPGGVDGTGSVVTENLPASCDAIQAANPNAASGVWWINPNGGTSNGAYQVQCDMARDGGGWTMGVKHWNGDGLVGKTGMFSGDGNFLALRGTPFKMSDADINTIVGGVGAEYDVMFDQAGFASSYSTGNHEYAILRKYKGTFRFDTVTPDTTPANHSVQSYTLADNSSPPNGQAPWTKDTLAWSGNLQCGNVGSYGINCDTLLSGVNPQGGPGCNINMGKSSSSSYHRLYMSNGSDTYQYLCNSEQASSTNAPQMNHRFWFRKTRAFKGVPGPDGTLVVTSTPPTPTGGTNPDTGLPNATLNGLPRSCDDIQAANPSAATGLYQIDPDLGSSSNAFKVMCDMERDGGGWTGAIKYWYTVGAPPIYGLAGAYGGVATWDMVAGATTATSNGSNYFKMSDANINTVVGGNSATYDVMFDEAPGGFNNTSNGNYEYVVLRNYTKQFTFAALTGASTTPTSIQSYTAVPLTIQGVTYPAHSLAWSGAMNNCGYAGGVGINCYTVTAGPNPGGGWGCAINMGKQSDHSWHHLFMAQTNYDSYMHMCNGAQGSSNQNTNHRYWFRKTRAFKGVKSGLNGSGALVTTSTAPNGTAPYALNGLPRSCDDIQKANPSAASGLYYIDPTLGSSFDAYQVQCDMETDGGGWTMGIKHWYYDMNGQARNANDNGNGLGGSTYLSGYTEALGWPGDAAVLVNPNNRVDMGKATGFRGFPFKLSDADINMVACGSTTCSSAGLAYDVLFDANGFYSAYAYSNDEYAILRNYVGTFKWNTSVPESTTGVASHSVQVYQRSTDALAWEGNLNCGMGSYGINCDSLQSGVNPAGGTGCNINMGKTFSTSYTRLDMSTGVDSYMYMCAGPQASSNNAPSLNHRFWFRPSRAFKGVASGIDGTGPLVPTSTPPTLTGGTNPDTGLPNATLNGLPRSCDDVQAANPDAISGTYFIDPNLGSSNDAFQTRCEMERDGGGWTLGITNWNGSGIQNNPNAFGAFSGWDTLPRTSPFKMSDANINIVAGSTYDVMFDQKGVYQTGSSGGGGNTEFTIVRNYTGVFKFNGVTPDATPTTHSIQVYKIGSAGNDLLAWTGNLLCGVGAYGINCRNLLAGPNPAGGWGCAINMARHSDMDWRYLYMDTGGDSYMYMCNGNQASSNGGANMFHRFWFRKTRAWKGLPDANGVLRTGVGANVLPISCDAIHTADAAKPSGLYWIDPTQGSTTDAYQVQCDMVRDGGGWTLGMKRWYQEGNGIAGNNYNQGNGLGTPLTTTSVNSMAGQNGALGWPGDSAMTWNPTNWPNLGKALGTRGFPFKLSDADINRVACGAATCATAGLNYDVMEDQGGYFAGHTNSNNEYMILRNYLGTFRFDGATPDATPAAHSVQSYRASDDLLLWNGNLQCGASNWGINCWTLLAGVNPQGGPGCNVNLSLAGASAGSHYFYMSDTNSDSYQYMCSGSQASSNGAPQMNHRFWFRKTKASGSNPLPAGVPNANVTDAPPATTGLPKSCAEILAKQPDTPSGSYWINPASASGSSTGAYQAYCDMTRDGGGWTLVMKRYAGDGMTSGAGTVGTLGNAIGTYGTNNANYKSGPYKLSDADIKVIASDAYGGSSANFDVMVDQTGYHTSYSTGNHEYAVLRNYTGTWSFTGPVAESSTPTSLQSYTANSVNVNGVVSAANALAWTGTLNCGAPGYGINCDGVASVASQVANPGGGIGCAINLGSGYDSTWARLYMSMNTYSQTAGDTLTYLCNGAQNSSGGNLTPRYWIRPAKPSGFAGVPKWDGSLATANDSLPTSCLAIKQANPSAADGKYWIDPDGGTVTNAINVACDMTRQGGGWTLGLKHWYQSGLNTNTPIGNTSARNGGAVTLTKKGYPYKLSDATINLIASDNYDILWDQIGWNTGYSTGNHEYLVMRNYTAPFTFASVTADSSTPAVTTSYRIADDVANWSGQFRCGDVGGWGINCYNIQDGSIPAGGAGCASALGTWTGAGAHHMYMSDTNSDTYLYMCNGQQHTSGYDLNHRYWFRVAQKSEQDAGPPVTVAATNTNTGSEPGGATKAAESCLAIKTAIPSSVSGTYWINPLSTDPTKAFKVYCDMTTDGGGWTMVRNIAPTDGNSVGYDNQAFWSKDAEYGTYGEALGRDYKSPADWQLAGDQIMIQSTATGPTGGILGYRIWPTVNNVLRTFDSFFTNAQYPPNLAKVPCMTDAPLVTVTGTSSAYDDILRQGSCLYADQRYGDGSSWDAGRLSTRQFNFMYGAADNAMAGFGACINCPSTWNSPPFMGVDRAPCNSADCSYASMCRMQPGTAPGSNYSDCSGSYCSGTYWSSVGGPNYFVCPAGTPTGAPSAWNSRFFVRKGPPAPANSMYVVGNNGTTDTKAAVSCSAIKAVTPSAPDGTYWLNVGSNGGGPFQAWCDMTTNGGGWTLVRNIAPNDANSVGYNNQAFWTTPATYGSYDDYSLNNGLSAGAPGSSCWTIKQAFSGSTDGLYYTSGSAGVSQVYCDMTTDGGGWTLVMQVASSSSVDGTLGFQASYWTSANVLNNTPALLSNINAKYEPFNSMRSLDGKVMIKDKANGNFSTLNVPSLTGSTLLERFQTLGKTNLTLAAGKQSPQELMGYAPVSGTCAPNAKWMMNFIVSHSGARLGNDVATNNQVTNSVSSWPCYNGEGSNLAFSGVGGTLESGRQWQDGYGSESLDRYRAGFQGLGSHHGVALFVRDGSARSKFASDYKGPADWQVAGNQVMIQSSTVGEAGTILGWRQWPMLAGEMRTFASFFQPGAGAMQSHNPDACETQPSNAVSLGTTSSWDDIIRQGTCLYSDVNGSPAGSYDEIRLSTIQHDNVDNRMAGFGACIDCGTSWNNPPDMGMDRAPCNAASCANNTVCRMPATGTAPSTASFDCIGSYCPGSYGQSVGNCPANSPAGAPASWNSRFYVRTVAPTAANAAGTSQNAAASSCLAIKTANSSAATGTYWLNPYGVDSSTAFQTTCDMTTDGGGWTLIDLENTYAAAGWSDGKLQTWTIGGVATQVHGLWGAGGNSNKLYDLKGIAHTKARIRARYYAVDTWDNETNGAQVWIDGMMRWATPKAYAFAGTGQPGWISATFVSPPWTGAPPAVNGYWNVEAGLGLIAHTGTSLKLDFRTGLDAGYGDEEFGFSHVQVWVR